MTQEATTLEHWQETAAATEVDNDATFEAVSEEEEQREDDLLKFSTTSFCISVPSKGCRDFHKVVKDVLPKLWNQVDERASK